MTDVSDVKKRKSRKEPASKQASNPKRVGKGRGKERGGAGSSAHLPPLWTGALDWSDFPLIPEVTPRIGLPGRWFPAAALSTSPPPPWSAPLAYHNKQAMAGAG